MFFCYGDQHPNQACFLVPKRDRKRTKTAEKKNILGRTEVADRHRTPKTTDKIKNTGANFNIKLLFKN